MIITRNFINKEIPAISGDTLKNCHLIRFTPQLIDVADLTVDNCNCKNCSFPEGTVLKGKNIFGNFDFCSHLHPGWDLGYVCNDDCRHTNQDLVIETTFVYDDGSKKIVKLYDNARADIPL